MEYYMHVSCGISLLTSEGLGDTGRTTAEAKTAVHRDAHSPRLPAACGSWGLTQPTVAASRRLGYAPLQHSRSIKGTPGPH
jgi:hypothetical protein